MIKKNNQTRKNQRKTIAYKSFEKKFKNTNKNYNKTFFKKIIHFDKDNKYTPQNDFYNWVNEENIKKTKVKKGENYIVQYDDFRIVQHKVYLELFDIIKKYLKENHNTPFSNCLKTFYHSSQVDSTLNQVKTNIIEKIKIIDELRTNKKNVWKMLALFNKSELFSWGSPFVYNMLPDEKDPTTFRFSLRGPQFSLIDLSIYFDDGTKEKYKKHYKNVFLRYVNHLFHTVLGPNNGLNAEDVFNTEVKMINAYACTNEKESLNNYNRITKDYAKNHFQFDFDEFCKELGFHKVPNWFICNNLNYLLCGTKILLSLIHI